MSASTIIAYLQGGRVKKGKAKKAGKKKEVPPRASTVAVIIFYIFSQSSQMTVADRKAADYKREKATSQRRSTGRRKALCVCS